GGGYPQQPGQPQGGPQQPGYPQGGQPGYPQTPPPGFPGGAQQFGQNPYADSYATQQFPGGPGGEPPKKKTGLIVGIAIAAVVVIGGAVAAILLLTGGDDNNTSAAPSTSAAPPASSSEKAPSSSRTPTSSSTPKGTAAPGAKSTPEETAQAIATAYSTGDKATIQSMVCASRPQSVPDIPSGITVTVTGSPDVTGDTAYVPVHAVGPGGTNDFELGLANEGGVWCYLGDRTN
ncbi:hypothetical protein ABZ215_42540, partial [Amycolatopsis sp. NPDC006131]|uniref:hypothetical protein n=1 Tax=Amycolatopsis sp. NPDC006131 TaxID=3156731 RepID=UPI00339F1264